jgi:DNA invertase Pin-like site-specific DNA recombinase
MAAHRTPRWSQSEIAVLEEFYPAMGVDCVDYLPGRSWKSVHQKAFKLGIACDKRTSAPQARLQGHQLEEAIRLREVEGWSFARIGARLGVAEASACNAVLTALCPRKGFKPAERDELGCLTPAGMERVRYALKKGLKGVDIQLRLGVSAGCVAEQRRRYNRELKANGKALLPPPGGGAAYSGVKLSKDRIRQVETLFLEGLGTLKVSERTGASKTSCTRIRNRLVRRLKRKGEALPGCDVAGTRHVQAESARFIPDTVKQALRQMLLQGEPVQRAARMLALGSCSAYRIRNELVAELESRGQVLPKADRSRSRRGSATADPHWPPAGAKAIYAFRQLLEIMEFDDAKALWRQQQRDLHHAERQRPKTFEEQLARVGRGEIGIAPAIRRAHLQPRVQEAFG